MIETFDTPSQHKQSTHSLLIHQKIKKAKNNI